MLYRFVKQGYRRRKIIIIHNSDNSRTYPIGTNTSVYMLLYKCTFLLVLEFRWFPKSVIANGMLALCPWKLKLER